MRTMRPSGRAIYVARRVRAGHVLCLARISRRPWIAANIFCFKARAAEVQPGKDIERPICEFGLEDTGLFNDRI